MTDKTQNTGAASVAAAPQPALAKPARTTPTGATDGLAHSGPSNSTSNKVSTKSLLTLTWVTVLVLVGNIAAGMIMIWSEHDVWIWARVVFSLGVLLVLLILTCMLIYAMSKIRLEE